jgi:hypothetical protein
MAGLKIKHYVKTGVIRSIGDAPNGVLGIDFNNGEARFIVHPKMQPASCGGRPGVTYQEIEADPVEEGAVVVSAEEVVEASLHCDRTIAMVWQSCVAAVQQFSGERLLLRFDVERIQSTVELAKEVRDQLAVNGFIAKGGGS